MFILKIRSWTTVINCSVSVRVIIIFYKIFQIKFFSVIFLDQNNEMVEYASPTFKTTILRASKVHNNFRIIRITEKTMDPLEIFPNTHFTYSTDLSSAVKKIIPRRAQKTYWMCWTWFHLSHIVLGCMSSTCKFSTVRNNQTPLLVRLEQTITPSLVLIHIRQ